MTGRRPTLPLGGNPTGESFRGGLITQGFLLKARQDFRAIKDTRNTHGTFSRLVSSIWSNAQAFGLHHVLRLWRDSRNEVIGNREVRPALKIDVGAYGGW